MDDFDFLGGQGGSGSGEIYRNLVVEFNRCSQLARARKARAKRWWGVYNGDAWDTIFSERGVYKPHDIQLPEMNQIKKYVDSVVGQQLNTKRRIAYTARTVDNAISSEMLSNAAEWFADSSNLDAETADVFKDCVIGGIGVLDIGLDFSSDPHGAPYACRIDPQEMIFDENAQKTNLEDCRYMFRLTPQPLGVLKDMFPDCNEQEFGFPVNGINAPKIADIRALAEGDYPAADATDANNYENTAYDEPSRMNQKRWLLEARWLEKGEDYWLDAETWDIIDNKEEYEMWRRAYPERRWVKGNYQRTCRAYLGAHGLLQPVDEPLCKGGSFGWIPLTCYRDYLKKNFYGLVKNAIDPQMFINQAFAIISKNLMTASKGGVMIEKRAVDDPVKFETGWSKGDSVLWLENGGIEAIKDKPLGQIAPVVMDTLKLASEALPNSMGISPEFLGITNRNQPNVLEETRKQSTLNVLTEVYDNLRRWRIKVGDAIAYIIQHWIPNGVLMRISDNDEKKYIQFARESVANLNYDVIVDDVPNSVNDQEKTFAYLSQLTPQVVQMLGANVPMEFVIEMMRYSPLPASFVTKIIPILQQWQQEQQQNMQAQAQAEQQGQQAELQQKQQEMQAQIQDRQQQFQLKVEELKLRGQELQLKAQSEQSKNQQSSQLGAQKIAADVQKSQAALQAQAQQAAQQSQIEYARLQADAANTQREAQNDAADRELAAQELASKERLEQQALADKRQEVMMRAAAERQKASIIANKVPINNRALQ